MKEFLYFVVGIIARIHAKLLTFNDAYEYHFSDKELHFLVIGILGMLMVFFIHPIFKLLAETGHVMIITWIYVMTLIVVITFAIEIGQKISHTGSMEFVDIVFGIVGFIAMFAIFAFIRSLFFMIIRLFRKETPDRK